MATTDTVVTSALKMVPSPGSGEWYFAVLVIGVVAVLVGLRFVDKKFRSEKTPSDTEGLPCTQHSTEIAERRSDYVKISGDLHSMELRIIDRMDEKLAEERTRAEQRDAALRRELSDTRTELTDRIDDRIDKLEERLVASIGAMFRSSSHSPQLPFQTHKE